MARLFGWDYSTPYYYMVTVKRLRGLKPLAYLSSKAEWGRLPNRLTRKLTEAISRVRSAYGCGIESLEPYVIMPDHLHFLIKIADVRDRPVLDVFVKDLIEAMTEAYNACTGHAGEVFDRDWHDLIVKKVHQLSNFANYIRDNPKNYLMRINHGGYFCRLRGLIHWRLGPTPFDLYGNPELLSEPAMLAIKVTRKTGPGQPTWENVMALCRRWRPGVTAVGTWYSPAEQKARDLILEHGGNIIQLCPHGFPDRWAPKGEWTRKWGAKGRLLFISLYQPETRQPERGVTPARCHFLNEVAAAMAKMVYDTRAEDAAGLPLLPPDKYVPRRYGQEAALSRAARRRAHEKRS